MEIQAYTPSVDHVIDEQEVTSNKSKNFIEANTLEVTLSHLQNDCIVPVFSKDNESTISHFEFIKHTKDVIEDILTNNIQLLEEIRVSHIVKGRIPTAIGKSAKDLSEEEKTIYYERCAFVIEIPEISQVVNGNKLNLAIGGVRAYNQENLYSRKSIEKFKVFIGFQNTVCLNLCIASDGLADNIRISSVSELKTKIVQLIHGYNRKKHLEDMESLEKYSINEDQFAYLIGKMKMYQYLTKEEKKNLFQLSITDSQITSIVKDYYSDLFFCSTSYTINLWKLYNLFTEANKSSYIDNHLERNLKAYEFIQYLANCLKTGNSNWFIYNITMSNSAF
ncbi:MAG: DUF3871 family protein [Flavobacterium nitrogenifigens]|uniref:DUF3871 family protein n=1 Tax=Flavobacterium nitrogenifigens TaxID=1617283 RepID=UPI0028077ABC|nr:DUF3871 family protein [Flavobacterium nitrogenifigens]MDQ8011393.1 DUF3871 family protein [Flavobacterium nitrogenifigens]